MYFDVTSFHKGCGRMNDDPPKDSHVQILVTSECYLMWPKKKAGGGVGNGDIILDYLGGL